MDKGNLAINCQYCHSSAEKSKHAGIPSTNVRMNCHQAVGEGHPEGTKEIAKIYAAVGWDATTLKSPKDPAREMGEGAQLPDHLLQLMPNTWPWASWSVRSAMVRGTEMDVAEQWAAHHGRCIKCHNEKDVKMAGNAITTRS